METHPLRPDHNLKTIVRGLIHFFNSTARIVIRCSAGLVRPILSLAARKKLVTWIERRRIPRSYFITNELLKDLRGANPNMFHRFLWSNHSAYAVSYEVLKQFGTKNLDPTRQALFADIEAQLRLRGLNPSCDVRSVFDMGCSLGYVLRYAEENVFPSATTLQGLDIDQYAVEMGSSYLRSLNSKIQLITADMADADRIMGDQNYDVIICCGVLMYLDETAAAQVVRIMLSHAKYIVGIICLAHPKIDNAVLEHSVARSTDGAWAHNLDRMIGCSDGTVILRRWGGILTRSGSPGYVILATPR